MLMSEINEKEPLWNAPLLVQIELNTTHKSNEQHQNKHKHSIEDYNSI